VNKLIIFAGALLALAGCATAPAPDEQLRLTEQAIDQARAVGAADTTSPLTEALSKTAQARAEMASGHNKAARMALEQAELDARLAEANELARKSREQLAQVNARIQRLHKQLGDVQ
jgi:predicted transglutaminase-like cysteine proteinase